MHHSLVGTLSKLFPRLTASFAYRQLTSPQVRKLRPNEEDTLNKSEQEDFKFGTFKIKLYRWGGGEKTVLLIHGWEGQAGNFADLVEKLLEENYTVYAFDGPSHGYSSNGKTSLFEFTELVAVLIRRFKVKTLVSHSFGGVATTYALFKNKDLVIDTYVLLTTPDRFIERIQDVSEATGISQKVQRLLIERLEKETGQRVDELNVSDFVSHIHVNRALIIHDKDDRVIPIERSRNVYNNWKGCRFTEVHGTGHFRMLRTDTILNEVLEFLGEEG
ncbi:MAG: alpha/beta hydrolase [Bacteroidota bacterium]